MPQGPAGAWCSACVVPSLHSLRRCRERSLSAPTQTGPLVTAAAQGPEAVSRAASATTVAVSQNKGHKCGSPRAPRVAATALPRPPASCHHLPWRSLWPLLAPPRPWAVVPAFLLQPASRVEPQLASAPSRPAPVPGPRPWPPWAQGDWDGCRGGSQVERNRRELVQEEHWCWSPPEWVGWAGLAPQSRVKR